MIALNTYMCVCRLAQYTHTHFLGACSSSHFFRSLQTQKTSSLLAALLMWIRIPFLDFPPTPFSPAVATQRDLLLQLYCAGNAFCALHFIAASICFCKQTSLPFIPPCVLATSFRPTDLLLPFTQTVARCEVCATTHTHTHTHILRLAVVDIILRQPNEACKGYIGELLYKYFLYYIYLHMNIYMMHI